MGQRPDGKSGSVAETGQSVTDIRQHAESAVGSKNDIELRLAARLVHLPIVRSVAANIAMRADFDLDSISDIEMAVDETCSTLITRAAPDTDLTARFTIGTNKISFAATVLSDNSATPSTSTFGWRVLATLADSVETWSEPSADRFHLVHIELSKRRPVVQG